MIVPWNEFLSPRARPAIRSLAFVLALLGLAATPSMASNTCTEGPLHAGDAEVRWRWIGILTSGDIACDSEGLPSSGQWTARRMFGANARSLWPQLEPFCVYEHDGTLPGASTSDQAFLDILDGTWDQTSPLSLQGPKPNPILSSITPDVMAVTTMGSLGRFLRPRLGQLFDEQVGRLATLPTDGINPVADVRLSLLDTSPTTGTGVPCLAGLPCEASDHGRTLRLMARHLLCPDGPCLVDIRSRLALAYQSFDADSRAASHRDVTQGGFFGLVGELAEAIVAELEDWVTGAGPGDRLVLNLSLAWDPMHGGAPHEGPNTMAPPVRAVHRALDTVACEPGAIAVAATGNQADDHPYNESPTALVPGVWREREASCGEAMVLAVGGVDRGRHPLVNAIPNSMPEVVAYADHGTLANSSLPGGPAAVLTGSSVATLVVASTLAAVAAYRTDLSLVQASKKLYRGAENLGLPADVCASQFAPACPNSRAVALCEVLLSACSGSPGSCPSAFPSCPARPSTPPALPGLPSLPPLDALAHGLPAPAPVCASACGEVALREDSDYPAGNAVCPDRRFHGVGRRPHSHPQPQSAMCPTCTYSASTGTFHAEIEAAPGQTLSSPSLELICPGSSPLLYFLSPNGGSPLADGDQFQVNNLPTGCQMAALTYLSNPGGGSPSSAAQPALVAQ